MSESGGSSQGVPSIDASFMSAAKDAALAHLNTFADVDGNPGSAIAGGVEKALRDQQVQTAAEQNGVLIGNGRQELQIDFAAKHPFAAAAITLANPIREELMYRALPEKLRAYFERRGQPGVAAAIGIGSVAVFALTHIGNEKRLPIPQAVAGYKYQQLYRKQGLRQTVIAHTANNVTASALAAPKILDRRKALKSQKP